MANKPITPTGPILATSTIAGGVRVRRGVVPPSSILATSTINAGGFKDILAGGGIYTPPYSPPVATVPIPPPSTTNFGDAVYDDLNLDELVGVAEWENLIEDPLWLDGIGAWTCDSNWTIALTGAQNIFGPFSVISTKASAGPNNIALECPAMSLQPGVEYAASVYVFIPTSYGGNTVYVSCDSTFAGAVVDNTHATANMAIRNQWQRLWVVIVPAVGDVAGNPIIVHNDPAAPVGSVLYITNPQVELGGEPNDFTDNSNFAPPKVITKSFLHAIGAGFEQMDALAHAVPSWSNLMDLDSIPDEGLQWFGQFSGTIVNPNLTYSQQRDQIRNNPGWNRGSPNSLIQAVRAVLTGTQTVNIIERDTSPYHFAISTYSGETPDQNMVIIAINHNKPAGLQYTYTVTPGLPATSVTYSQLYFNFVSYQKVYDEMQTYQDIYTSA